MNNFLIICGPTATGKTALALRLARKFHGELISADSRQVYNGFDALTGKDRPETGDERIWMYDVVDIDEVFSVSQYQKQAQQIIADIEKRDKLPIVVGGTGLYLKALTQPLSYIHIPPNTTLRKEFDHIPCEILQEELKRVDHKKWDTMNESDRNNPRRLIRAIEIAQWGTSHYDRETIIPKPVDALWIGLTAPLPDLEDRIRKRVMIRWEGATREVQEMRVHPSIPILGFSMIQQFLQGKLSKNDAIEMWVREERKYAKRQLTWFQKQPKIYWFDITKVEYQSEITKLVGEWYTKYT